MFWFSLALGLAAAFAFWWRIWPPGFSSYATTKDYFEYALMCTLVGLAVAALWTLILAVAIVLGIAFVITWLFGKAYSKWG